MKRITAVLTMLAIWVSTLAVMVPMTGCTVTAAQIQADGATVGRMLISMASVVQDPVQSSSLLKAGNALIAATANFQLGSPKAIIDDAINAAQAIMSSIPQTQQFAILLPIAEAAIDILLGNLNSVGTDTSLNKMAARAHPNTVRLATIHHRIGRSASGDVRAAYNGALKQYHVQAPAI